MARRSRYSQEVRERAVRMVFEHEEGLAELSVLERDAREADRRAREEDKE